MQQAVHPVLLLQARAAGGLRVIITSLGPSWRVIDQLKGRSGRQGDPGESFHLLNMLTDVYPQLGDLREKLMDSGAGASCAQIPSETRLVGWGCHCWFADCPEFDVGYMSTLDESELPQLACQGCCTHALVAMETGHNGTVACSGRGFSGVACSTWPLAHVSACVTSPPQGAIWNPRVLLRLPLDSLILLTVVAHRSA